MISARRGAALQLRLVPREITSSQHALNTWGKRRFHGHPPVYLHQAVEHRSGAPAARPGQPHPPPPPPPPRRGEMTVLTQRRNGKIQPDPRENVHGASTWGGGWVCACVHLPSPLPSRCEPERSGRKPRGGGGTTTTDRKPVNTTGKQRRGQAWRGTGGGAGAGSGRVLPPGPARREGNRGPAGLRAGGRGPAPAPP